MKLLDFFKGLKERVIEEGSKRLVRRGATTFDGSRVGIIGGGAQPAEIVRRKIKS